MSDGLKVNENISTVVGINADVGRRRWRMGDGYMGEVEEYTCLGVTVKERKNADPWILCSGRPTSGWESHLA